MRKALLIVLVMVVTSSMIVAGKASVTTHQKPIILEIKNMPYQELSKEERDALKYMVEEEKLARDVYSMLYKKWGQIIFKNIAESEQTHIDMVITLLEKYKVEYEFSNEIGVFYNEELKKLYKTLIEKGFKSLEAALNVGATIEDVDIYDITRWLKKVDNDDIKFVFNNLIKGSKNHMRAFNSQLEKMFGYSYKAQYITQKELEEILSTTTGNGERGGSSGGKGPKY